jgi:hypothetical protein
MTKWKPSIRKHSRENESNFWYLENTEQIKSSIFRLQCDKSPKPFQISFRFVLDHWNCLWVQ